MRPLGPLTVAVLSVGCVWGLHLDVSARTDLPAAPPSPHLRRPCASLGGSLEAAFRKHARRVSSFQSLLLLGEHNTGVFPRRVIYLG